jgi:hypothetical protein
VVDLLWKTKATHFLGVPESGVDVYEPVTGTLHKYGLAHLTETFTKNRVDAAAFTRLTEDQVRVYFNSRRPWAMRLTKSVLLTVGTTGSRGGGR